MPASRDSSEESPSDQTGAPGVDVPKVSVVVPVYNPGRYIEDCIGSLLRQSLPASDFEVIFVDDGSTDATPQRLDALAAEHDHIQVIHQENSGWPGKPRNVGVATARGDYVLFMDNDDWLGDEALERMHAYATAHDADILIPRYVGHGRGVARELFSRNIPRTTLRRTPQVIDSMTPHKMVRRAFIREHGLRFPEGRRRLEDHVFFIEAYLLAEAISVLSDYACYHHVNRDDGANAARTRYDPKGYFGNVREVLDIIDTHTEPGAFRDRLYLRWYGNELMGRVDKGTFLRHPPEFQEQVFTEVHKLSLERFGEHLIERFGASRRVRAHLIREGDLDAYRTFLAHDLKVRVQARLTAVHRTREPVLAVELAGTLDHPDAPLFREQGGGVVYALPGDLGERLPETATTVTEEALRGRVRLVLHGRRSEVEHFVPVTATLAFAPASPGEGSADGGSADEDSAGQDRTDGRCLAFTASAEIDLLTAATGSRLPADDWELKVRIASCSWSANGWVGPLHVEAPVTEGTGAEGPAVQLATTHGGRRVALRVPRPVTARTRQPQTRPAGWRLTARRLRRGLRRRLGQRLGAGR